MKLTTTIPALALAAILTGCGEKDSHNRTDPTQGDSAAPSEEADHDHGEEAALGSFKIGGMDVEAAQAHGNVEAGKEGHLVIKLPYQDDGATIVRAWIGTEDRTLSTVGKGAYASAHGDYDIHTMAPDPLPEGARWWLEVEKPDGTTVVGSFPLLKDIEQE